MPSYAFQYLTSFPRTSAVFALVSVLSAFWHRSQLNWWFAFGLGSVCLWLALKVMIAGAFHSRIFSFSYRPGLNLLMIGILMLAALALSLPTLLMHV